MTDSSLPANVQLGFLTIAAEGAGMVGGLLVTNCWGRPLEFRLSTAVQPTRVQQILYGPTLHEYLTADLIGKTLLDKSSTGVHLLIVDAPPLLGIRSRLAYPAIALGGEGFDESKHFLLDHARCTKPLAVPLSHEPDRERILAILERIDPGLDLVEPFTRIREAMGEARRLGGRPVQPPDTEYAFDEIDVAIGIYEPPEVAEAWERPMLSAVRDARLLNDAPWTRAVGPLEIRIQTEGWKFPAPALEQAKPDALPAEQAEETLPEPELPDAEEERKPKKRSIRPRPTGDTVLFKDRLLYLLQPPLDNLFDGRNVQVPFPPFKYQLEGIAFLMPRHAALLADEMGLGKTMQTILAMRLMFQSGMIRSALLICPKPLVFNWARELKLWSGDMPFEIFDGNTADRRATWLVSNCPLKIINYEILTRDAEMLDHDKVFYDLVVLDEAQRIKNHDSKTARVVRSVKRSRSWALTGTPIENRPEDLAHIFAFVDPGRIPSETPAKMYPQLTQDSILRRTKEIAQSDMPPKITRDLAIELTREQKEAYELAEKDGIVHLNELGDTITVQHVFQLVMRLKQICNFDPRTGASAKMEQLIADMAEVAESGRKAIVFSQWVEPLEVLAEALKDFGPLQFHGKIPSKDRPAVLDRFKEDPSKHVILMSYGTGSVGLNLQFTNYVFLFDRWWNPAIEDQAINRAHRIGQKHPVTVTRFIAENTIETRIAEILEAKRKVFNDLLANNGPPTSMGLDEDEIFGLFDIKARPKHGKAA